MRHRGEQGVYCPSIFTLTRTRWTRRYELRLYCEHPEGPHPLDDDSGLYRFRRLPAWLVRYAPYLRILMLSLRYAIPVAGPALTGFGVTLTEADKGRLEASCKLLEAIAATPDINHGISPDTLTQSPAHPRDTPREISGLLLERTHADFSQLRQALIQLDPGQEWGGLRERELPESRGIVYLCTHHRQALHYPATPPPTDLPDRPA